MTRKSLKKKRTSNYVNTRLIIFLKNPVAGKVKTRLAKGIGHDRALQAYKLLTAYTLAQAKASTLSTIIYWSDHIVEECTTDQSVQVTGDLGERMLIALKTELAMHDSAILIGSDCPGMSSDLLVTAASCLDSHDAVIGPADDGGYYLIGMKAAHKELFTELTYSTDHLLQDTLSRAKDAHLQVAILETISDVDYLEDLQSFLTSARADHPLRAPLSSLLD